MKKMMMFVAMMTVLAAAFAQEVIVSVGAGGHWKAKSTPQCVVWLEDAAGNFIRTLYVTNRAGKRSWLFGPKEGRPESLPVWYHASKHQGAAKADASGAVAASEKLDAVTSATPKGGFVFTTETGGKACRIRAEFNTSFDYNDTYTKKNSGVNGQPSVVYGADIPEGFASGEISLSLLGTGSLDGSDGEIHSGTPGLTTAPEIVKSIEVTAK